MSEHFEPWHLVGRKARAYIDDYEITIATVNSALRPTHPGVVEVDMAKAKEIARHIVACVNACQNISTEKLEEVARDERWLIVTAKDEYE